MTLDLHDRWATSRRVASGTRHIPGAVNLGLATGSQRRGLGYYATGCRDFMDVRSSDLLSTPVWGVE
jgi:hypothetical protein